VRLGAYNSAGELVKLIFDGAAQYRPGTLSLSESVIPGGEGGVSIGFPGYLYDPSAGPVTSVLWLADNNGAQPVSGGVYVIKAEIVDQFGSVTTLQQSVQVVGVHPANALVIYNSAGEIVARPALPVTAGGRSLTSVWMKEQSWTPEFDASGVVVGGLSFYFKDELGNQYSTVWDGRNSEGAPVNSGNYTAQLVYQGTGAGAGQIIETRGFVVLRSQAAASLDSAVVGPNPLLNDDPLRIRYTPSHDYPVHVRLFDLAGALADQGADPAGSGWVTLRKGLAPGVYVLELTKQSGSSVVARRMIKVAVVR
jgi:hypothetical protein